MTPKKPDARVSIEDKITAFYTSNPAELLTLADMASKFGVSEEQVRGGLKRMRRYGTGIQLKAIEVFVVDREA